MEGAKAGVPLHCCLMQHREVAFPSVSRENGDFPLQNALRSKDELEVVPWGNEGTDGEVTFVCCVWQVGGGAGLNISH